MTAFAKRKFIEKVIQGQFEVEKSKIPNPWFRFFIDRNISSVHCAMNHTC